MSLSPASGRAASTQRRSRSVPLLVLVPLMLGVLIAATPANAKGAGGTAVAAVPRPAVTAVSPAMGPTYGNVSITVTGSGFTPDSSVTFSGAAANAVQFDSDTQLTVHTPAHAAARTNVYVKNSGGTSPTTSSDYYTFTQLAITSVSPAAGPVGGGTVVHLTGTGFTGADVVTLGDNGSVAPTVNSDTRITFTTPPGTAGATDIGVATYYDYRTVPAAFTYQSQPAVSAVSPAAGPTAGGQSVTITGSDLTPTSTVTFSGAAATDVHYDSDTQLTVTTPAHAAGQTNVYVRNAGGTSPANSGDHYTYIQLAITGVSPAAGPVGGGTVVRLTGSGFTDATTVNVGGTDVVPTVNGDTRITFTTPPGTAGPADITVTTPTGVAVKTGGFDYRPQPTVTSVSPSVGSSSGGQSVTVNGSDFTPTSTVTFGSAAATDVHYDSDTQLTVTAPAHATGRATFTSRPPAAPALSATATSSPTSPPTECTTHPHPSFVRGDHRPRGPLSARRLPSTIMLRIVRSGACVAVLAMLIVGCSSPLHGSGTSGTRASSSASGSSSPSSSKSDPAGRSGNFPRVPFATAIGDPATADVCAAIPLASFAGLRGFTAVHDGQTFPPGCTVRIKKGSTVAFTVLAYGVNSSSFSHLGPPHVSKVIRTGKLHGIPVNYYAFASKPIGDCARDVLADGVTFKIDVLGSSSDGNSPSIEKLHCAAANAMTNDLAAATGSRHFPRLKLATASLTRIDFCAALRSTRYGAVTGFAHTVLKVDGAGDGCQLTRGSSLSLYLDFDIQPTAVPATAVASTVGGHRLYADEGNDQASSCTFTSVQGRTPDGRYEALTASSNVTPSSARPPKRLCTDTAAITARFLDAVGLH